MCCEPLGDDQARLLRRAAFEQRDGSRLLDAVDVGLREDAAHLAVEVFQARDDEDGVGQPVGDLDEIAHGALEALLGVGEEAQILDLIDAEHERGAIDGPHQPPRAAMISKARSSPVFGSSAATA